MVRRVNESGGIGGRRLRLVALDDSHQADPVKDNMWRLTDREQVVAVIGNVGTAGATVALSIANETGVMVRGLFKHGTKPQEIAFFTQNDGCGDSGFNGAVKAFNEAGFQDTQSLARQVVPSALFLNVSFVGSAALNQALGADAEGVIVARVVPHYDSPLPGVREFRAARGRFEADVPASFIQLEGFLAAKALVEGLRRASPITRERLIDALESGPIDIGTPLRYRTTEHQGSHQGWLTVIRNGNFVPLDW